MTTNLAVSSSWGVDVRLDSEVTSIMIRLLIADDHAVVRQGLRMFLSLDPDLEVVGEAENGEEALEMARELSPDVILMRSEEHTSELQSRQYLVCRLLLEKKKKLKSIT